MFYMWLFRDSVDVILFFPQAERVQEQYNELVLLTYCPRTVLAKTQLI